MKVIVAEMKDVEGFWCILCPKDGKKVPIYQCAGSFVRGKPICDHVQSVSMSKEEAKVECLWPEKTQEELT